MAAASIQAHQPPGIILRREGPEILGLLADGLTNAEVARQLWISEPTVKFHLSSVYEKLNVSNRTGAARWAQRHGLLSIE